VIWVRPDCEGWLRGPIEAKFEGIRDREPVEGRVPHFICRPPGAPFRVLVRSVARGGFLAFLGFRHLGAGRLAREQKALDAARAAGLRVPELVAYRVDPAGLFFKRLTVVYRVIEGAARLDLVLRETSGPGRWRVIERVANETRRLHDAGILHGDLNVKNFLVDDRIAILDFDRASLRGGDKLGELARLYRSLGKVLGPQFPRGDRARLVRAYLGPGGEFRRVLRMCERRLACHRLFWRNRH
jgi:hypothetical protein